MIDMLETIIKIGIGLFIGIIATLWLVDREQAAPHLRDDSDEVGA